MVVAAGLIVFVVQGFSLVIAHFWYYFLCQRSLALLWWCNFLMVLVEFLLLLDEQSSGIENNFILFIKDGIGVTFIVLIFSIYLFQHPSLFEAERGDLVQGPGVILALTWCCGIGCFNVGASGGWYRVG
jgi:hypothetical protein